MRVKTGTVRRQKHKKVIKAAKGYRMTRSRLYKVAKQAVLHAGAYAYHGRKLRKRQFRRLWIQRLNAALKSTDLSYSQFIKLLNTQKIELNRKILSELAVNHSDVFFKLVDKVK